MAGSRLLVPLLRSEPSVGDELPPGAQRAHPAALVFLTLRRPAPPASPRVFPGELPLLPSVSPVGVGAAFTLPDPGSSHPRLPTVTVGQGRAQALTRANRGHPGPR